MLVSIIMPYYNAASFINETVDAIINQTEKDWELIIVNDCSTDPSTGDVLASVQEKDNRIKVISTEQNGGAGVSRNRGIVLAKGSYIAFCDADDWWYPTKLEEQIKFMKENGYSFTCTYYEDANEKLETYYVMKQPLRQNYKMLLKGCNIGTPGVMYDSQIIGKWLFPTMRRAEDWGLWLMILKKVDFIYTYQKPLWKYRHIPSSETSNKWVMLKAVANMYKEVVGMTTFKAFLYCFGVFLPANILKKTKKIFA